MNVYCLPVETTTLFDVNIHVQELVFVHEIRKRKEYHAEGHDQGSNARVGDHDDQYHH